MMSPADGKAYWPAREAASSLNELAYFERATAHILSGWVAKVSMMDIKAQFGLHLHQAMDRAHRLRRSASAILRAEEVHAPVLEGWRALAMRVDAVVEVTSLLEGVYRVLTPGLVGLYHKYMAHTDPLADPGARRLISQILPEVEAQEAWGREILRQWETEGSRVFVSEGWETLWQARRTGHELPWADALWQPLDRVSQAARPPDILRLEVGSLGLLPTDALHKPRDTGMFLHSDLDEEYATLELIARNSYEHPDMPWEFHLDMARHASDEARHALLILRLLKDRGYNYGDFPLDTSSYDSLYQFPSCEPGSRKELLWRMLIRQTFMEGLALDSFADMAPRHEAAGQHDIAHALDFLVRDELFHAESGLRWSRYLLGDDPRAMLQERYEALQSCDRIAEAERSRWVQDNLDKAMAELVTLEDAKRRRGGKLKERPLNRVARRQAGFTDDDLLQVVSWGYADP